MGKRDEEITGSSIAKPVSRGSRVKTLTRNTQQLQPNTLYLLQNRRQVAKHKTSKSIDRIRLNRKHTVGFMWQTWAGWSRKQNPLTEDNR